VVELDAFVVDLGLRVEDFALVAGVIAAFVEEGGFSSVGEAGDVGFCSCCCNAGAAGAGGGGGAC
jgi:hypothetical protein